MSRTSSRIRSSVAWRHEKGLIDMADVVETTSLEVSGTIWAYRPKLKK